MENKKKIINKILYRATHRGTKEMDILLGNFVKKYIDTLNDNDLGNLSELLNCEDSILYNWYFNNLNNELIPINKISGMLKKFKL
jgi:antitoxin CptB